MDILLNKELKKGLMKIRKHTDEEINEIMNSMDTDRNGAINFNEFISATLNIISKDYKRVIKAFKFFDLDNDGLIDATELKDALAGQEFSNIDIDVFVEAIKVWDLDNDGKISFDEFAQIMSMKFDKLAKESIDESLQRSNTGIGE